MTDKISFPTHRGRVVAAYGLMVLCLAGACAFAWRDLLAGTAIGRYGGFLLVGGPLALWQLGKPLWRVGFRGLPWCWVADGELRFGNSWQKALPLGEIVSVRQAQRMGRCIEIAVRAGPPVRIASWILADQPDLVVAKLSAATGIARP